MAEKESTMAKQNLDNTLPFRAAVSHIFQNIIESVSKKQFSECQSFLKIKLSDTKFTIAIEKLHEKMVKDLQERLHEELEEMMAEESLSNSLGKLKQLATEYDSNQLAWRPPGDAILHLRTHDVIKIDEESEELTELVEDLENENDLLKRNISGKRQNKLIIDKKIMKATNTGLRNAMKMEKAREYMKLYANTLDLSQMGGN